MSRSKQSSAKKPARVWILSGAVLLLLAVLYSVMAGPRGLLKVQDLRAQQEQVQREIDSLQTLKQELIEEKQRLLTDTTYLEKLARKELGMARPGEKVYRFVTPASADSGNRR